MDAVYGAQRKRDHYEKKNPYFVEKPVFDSKSHIPMNPHPIHSLYIALLIIISIITCGNLLFQVIHCDSKSSKHLSHRSNNFKIPWKRKI